MPSVAVSGVSFQSYFVPSGSLSLFVIASSAFGVSPFLTLMSLPFGSFVDACDSLTVTGTSTIFDEPSLNVTFTFPV